MQSIKRVRKTDLARSTRQVINNVLRGQTAVVESHGQPEVAIMDIVDYRIIRAVLRYYAQQPEIDVEEGLADQQVTSTSDPQERFNLILAHYLAGAISLGRAAELLELPLVAAGLGLQRHLDPDLHRLRHGRLRSLA